LIIAKQRNGPTGTVPLIFREKYTRFENASHLGESEAHLESVSYEGEAPF